MTTRPVAAISQGNVRTDPKDAPPAVPLAFQVDMFLISFPSGAYSANEEFWKRMDEQCVSPATSDLLYKNGVRVGVAANAELEHFKKFIVDVAPLQSFTMAGTDMRNAQLPMKAKLPHQLLFYFDKTNEPIGKTFDGSDNLLNISFEPAMRKPGTLRLTICPMVRSSEQRVQYTVLNNELKYEYVNDEKLFDLNCKADIPPDCFLIITPSPDSWRASSIGNAFFMQDTPAEKRERVLLVIPRLMRIEQARAH